MNEEQIWELFLKKHHYSISAQELELLDNWTKQSKANQLLANEIMNLISRTEISQQEQLRYNPKVAWTKVETRLVYQSETKQTSLSVFHWAAAAVLVLGLIGVVYWMSNGKSTIQDQVTITTKSRESKKIQLPDGSQLWLNENSVLSYSKEFLDSIRVVNLTGEAFLQVAHNPKKPFLVRGKNFETRVLGTSFNVKLTDTENDVMVIDGKVKFSYKEGVVTKSSVIIQRGYQAKANANRELKLSQVANQNRLAWHTGILEFKNEKLADLVKDMSAFYGVSIQLEVDNSHEYLFTGTLQQVSIETALETVCYSLHLRWKKSAKAYVISNE